MSLRLTSLHLGTLQISGGANGLSLATFKGLGSPIPRVARFSRPRRHGSVERTRFYEGRMFELAGYIRGLSEAESWDLLDDLKEQVALDTDDAVVLKWLREGRDTEERVEVKIDGTLDYEADADQPTLIRWALSLFAPDPRIYSATLKSASYDPTTAGTGFGLTFPLTFDLTFPGEGSSTHLSVQNEGRFPTPPVLTAVGPVTNPIFENDTTGDRIFTQDTELLAGQELVVDVAARSVTLDGGDRPDLIDPSQSTWFELVKGVNLLRLNGTDMVGGQTELAVEFRDATI